MLGEGEVGSRVSRGGVVSNQAKKVLSSSASLRLLLDACAVSTLDRIGCPPLHEEHDAQY